MSSCDGLAACPGWVPPPTSRPRLSQVGPASTAAIHNPQKEPNVEEFCPRRPPRKQEAGPCGAVRGRAGPFGATVHQSENNKQMN